MSSPSPAPSPPPPSLNHAVIPLSVLCAGLVLGGVAAVLITRKIARARGLLDLQWAAEAQVAEEKLGEKPMLVDVYVGRSLDVSQMHRGEQLPWGTVQPISSNLHETLSSPHPHHSMEKRPGYLRSPLVDGNVLEVSVGIAMPSASSPGGADTALQSLDYCIGTSDVVVCSLLDVRQRLIGIN